MWYQYFKKNLETSLKDLQKSRNISLRQYAIKLKMSAGSLSEILSGKRIVSFQKALAIARTASFSEENLERMQRLYEIKTKKKPEIVLEDSATDLILNPLYYRTLCATEILPAPTNLKTIANFLEVEESALKPILSKLSQLNVIEWNGKNITWKGAYVSTSEDIPSNKIQSFFRKNLKASAPALDLPLTEREFTTVTFVGNMSEMATAKDHLRNFRDGFPDSMKSVEPNQIFELSIQLRPVSKPF